MWFETGNDDSAWMEAARHLSKVDPVLGTVIARVGKCEIKPRKDHFAALCRAIFAQQLNIRVAEVLFDRFCALLPGRSPRPQTVLELLKDAAATKGCGLSRQKAAYIRDLAQHFVDKRIPTRKLSRMSDEEVIEALVAVKGIGRWTAEIFLMFVLSRPDVLPLDDLGIREGFRDIYGLKERPTTAELAKFGERWRPYRSVASWYIWRRHSNNPIVEKPKPSKRIAKVKKAAQLARAATTRRSGRVVKKP
jgi:DNA-3-methyladenine glycosylase II